jgi:hypothetical protein
MVHDIPEVLAELSMFCYPNLVKPWMDEELWWAVVEKLQSSIAQV